MPAPRRSTTGVRHPLYPNGMGKSLRYAGSRGEGNGCVRPGSTPGAGVRMGSSGLFRADRVAQSEKGSLVPLSSLTASRDQRVGERPERAALLAIRKQRAGSNPAPSIGPRRQGRRWEGTESLDVHIATGRGGSGRPSGLPRGEATQFSEFESRSGHSGGDLRRENMNETESKDRCPECGGRYPKKVDRLGYGFRECFECNHWERVVA